LWLETRPSRTDSSTAPDDIAEHRHRGPRLDAQGELEGSLDDVHAPMRPATHGESQTPVRLFPPPPRRSAAGDGCGVETAPFGALAEVRSCGQPQKRPPPPWATVPAKVRRESRSSSRKWTSRRSPLPRRYCSHLNTLSRPPRTRDRFSGKCTRKKKKRGGAAIPLKLGMTACRSLRLRVRGARTRRAGIAVQIDPEFVVLDSQLLVVAVCCRSCPRFPSWSTFGRDLFSYRSCSRNETYETERHIVLPVSAEDNRLLRQLFHAPH